MFTQWYNILLTIFINLIVLTNSAFIPDIDQQGLYSKSDHVTILTIANFDKNIYGQDHAYLVQFYNSYCGHCRAFAPKFKALASEIAPWKNVVKLGVIDCSVEENNEICRQFEVMAYPSLRFLHENYLKGNAFIGDKFPSADTAEKLKINLITVLQNEQSQGRLHSAPSLNISSYVSYLDAINSGPKDTQYTFFVFEDENSTVGSQLILDLNDYEHVRVVRVLDNSDLAGVAKITSIPALVAVNSEIMPSNLTPHQPTKQNMLKAINTYLKSNNFNFPIRDSDNEGESNSFVTYTKLTPDMDIVYYTDLEKTLKTSLYTEITRYKVVNGDILQALLSYLDVLIVSFPAKYNLKEYLTDLHSTLSSKNEWSGNDIHKMVKGLASLHSPIFSDELDYIGCRGSQPQYRGYTCGLWTLFHTLTVNAANKSGVQGPKVLQAMHGYVKYFFGCTECSQHFQAMAMRNRLFDVKENDKAVLWLWISHNEVNLRLAGDVTEDPKYPKIQFPSVERCPQCRLARGAWNLAAVYEYLRKIYDAENIQDIKRAKSAGVAQSPFSNLDIGMLSLICLLHHVWRENFQI
ncbi:sulfhydryl oxidase 1-like isoform X1 [Leptidea sinapis]|uniref:sulfhydryl oxidase 1-like isoform X1 n=1 Tax=Leptidea sinapis TaxID=189913 RepID=UPI002127BA70|nr:sulfhydryl oxidase 1-like isoform X1 [Leptidea sinapis]